MHAPSILHDDAGLCGICVDEFSKNECNNTLDMSSPNDNTLSNLSTDEKVNENESDPLQILKKLKIRNLNRLIIGQLNINSLRNKF